ncbi:MAG: cell division ATP-binding protein FtsE [Deltaproteobacteria bacterium]|nr:cell division ATP-binding protein FtsE [Deltaproteobacteria bacterium]
MIRMFHVVKSYGPPGPPALNDLTCHIRKGEMVYLMGPSGAGKTTFLRLIYAADFPSSGQVLVAGRNVAKLRESSIPYLRRNIGVVFQDFKLLAGRTVFDNVALTLEVLGKSRKEITRRVHDALGEVGMHAKASAHPVELSGGEQQRVAIARALVGDPTVLLADEPTGNLDPSMSGEILELIRRVNLRGATVVVATHDPRLVASHPRRVIELNRGRIVADSGGKAA